MIHFKIVKDMYTVLLKVTWIIICISYIHWLNMLKYILSRYKISLLGYSRLLIKKKKVKISHNFIIKTKKVEYHKKINYPSNK
jgi:hypothetical protein